MKQEWRIVQFTGYHTSFWVINSIDFPMYSFALLEKGFLCVLDTSCCWSSSIILSSLLAHFLPLGSLHYTQPKRQSLRLVTLGRGKENPQGTGSVNMLPLPSTGAPLWKTFSWLQFQVLCSQFISIRRYIGIMCFSDKFNTRSAWAYFHLHLTSNTCSYQSIWMLLQFTSLWKNVSHRRYGTVRNAAVSLPVFDEHTGKHDAEDDCKCCGGNIRKEPKAE